MKTTLTFTIDGRFHCASLAPILRAAGRSGMKPVRIGGGAQEGDIGCESCPQFIQCGMSHVSAIAVSVDDLAAVQLLCEEKGWTFKENQKTYKWWGHHVGDYPLPEGMKKEDLGKCSHAIGVPGTNWEIGLVKNKTGGYRLAFDFYGSSGAPLQEAIGPNGGLFRQAYGVAKATLIAKKRGHYVSKTVLPNGSVKLVVTGV